MSPLVLHLALLLLFPPLLNGVIGKTKAWVAGRVGPPLWQPYLDLWRLLQKGAVYSSTTTWVFRAGPVIGLASVLTAGLLLPLVGQAGPLGFPGDMIAFAYLLGLARFFTMAAALDTGSSFEGMGASREAAFSTLVEPAFFLGLGALAIKGQTLSFAGSLNIPWSAWGAGATALLLVLFAMVVVLLAENARLPIDDPATHLELTMIHEVMVLDHGGPDLALIQYAATLKLFLFSALLAHMVLPISALTGWRAALLLLGGTLAVAVLVGIVESTMARLRLTHIPRLLVSAWALGAVGLMIVSSVGR